MAKDKDPFDDLDRLASALEKAAPAQRDITEIQRELESLNETRKRLGMPVVALARILGVNASTLNGWLAQDTVPRPTNWAKVRTLIAKLL